MVKKCISFLVFVLLAGCEKYYLSLRQIPVDAEYLASSRVGSPDPRAADPPFGQKIAMRWAVPPELLRERPELVLHVVYKNHTEGEFTYPVESRLGTEIFSCVGAEYAEKGGLLAYKAEIRLPDGTVYREWKHQLWVKLIVLKE